MLPCLPSTLRSVILVALLSFAAAAQNSADPGAKDPATFDPKRPLAQELQTSVPDNFKLIAVGDCIISRSLSQYAGRDQSFSQAVKLLKSADATYGNLETSILDIRQFKGHPYNGIDDVPLISDPAVARDLAAMGFDLMSRANNHALDWGFEGMRETTRWVDEAGIVTAGVGEDQALARAPHYYESLKGRIGIVSLASTFRPTSDALPNHGAAPGRPGINGLTVKKTIVLPADAMRDLSRLTQKIYPTADLKSPRKSNDAADQLSVFGTTFEAGPKRALRYEMDSSDLAGILKNVRQGKQHSDFLLVTIHSHESADTTAPDPKNDFEESPADFVHVLAKAAIDAGADAFLTTGIHHLGPIELYKGRPIYYGLGDFFWSDIQEPMPADFYKQYKKSLNGAFLDPDKATDADLTNVTNAEGFNGDLPFESVVTETRFDHNTVAEIRLYPIDLGYGLKLTESGIPRVAKPDTAMKILKRLQTISAPYGTKIQIEPSPEWNYVGVIRP